MPPINQQGSRAGLITALVVSIVVAVAALVFAIYYNAQMRQAQKLGADERKKYAEVTDDPNGALATQLRSARDNEKLGFSRGEPLLNVAAAQRDQLAAMISGDKDAAKAADAVRALSASLVEKLKPAGVTLPAAGGNLLATIDQLANAVLAKQNNVNEQTAATAALTKKVADLQAAMDKERQESAKQTAQLRQEVEAEKAKVASERQAMTGNVESINTGFNSKFQQFEKDITQKDQEIATRLKELDALRKDKSALEGKLAKTRYDVKEPLVRQADGHIARLGSNNIVYIDRGQGDGIVTGLTFEVYDRNEGVPSLGDGLSNDNLPVGKGSIEVVRVGGTSSECRVVKKQPGATISEGDIIANLVYDRNTKYNFMVYGDFDLDKNGVPTAQDAETIKRLITQWGGHVVDKVDVNTDFLVLGAEPTVPSFSKEELENPINQDKKQKAEAALQAYEDVKAKAVELHIPVLNQNRFLYFVGYYDQAGR